MPDRAEQEQECAPKLTWPQQQLLQHAARRRCHHPDEPDRHYAYCGRGKPATAKVLHRLGLGAYVQEHNYSRFWIWDRGYEVAQELGLVPAAGEES